MRRLWMIAAFSVVLLVPCAWAQHRGGSMGGMHGGSSFSHGSFHGPAMANHGGSFNSFHNNGVHFHTTFNSSFHRRGFRRFGYPYYPYYGYYGYDPSFLWGSASSYDSSDAYYDQNQQLSQQVNELSNQIERLRDEQEARAYTPPPPVPTRAAPSKSDFAPATVIVYQDQHREEIHNYAVVGHTLWIFSEDRARKIPLAQLDLSTTAKVNDDRGVDFNIPQ